VPRPRGLGYNVVDLTCSYFSTWVRLFIPQLRICEWRCRRISVFGHVVRLDDVTSANMALQLHINVSLNRPPDRTWRRPPGRPRNKWLVRLETSGGVLSTVDMVVQRRAGPRWLREHAYDDVKCRQ